MTIRPKPGFVVIEGPDGAGTTTQTRLLAKALAAPDLRVHVTAEPSQGPIGQVLRSHVKGELTLDPVTAALAFTADRADHLAREIRPALERGEWVVCDRYLLSTLAYQGAEGIDRSWVLAASAGFDVPDLTVYLKVAVDELARRLGGREATERYEGRDFAERVIASYDESIELLRRADHRIEVADGSADPATVQAAIKAWLDSLR